MKRLLLASLALLLGAGCALDTAPEDDAASTEDAILGGGVERQYPAVGMLRFASGGFGTGALVSPNVVLTAGHVARGKPIQFFYGAAAAGKDPRPENLHEVGVAEILIHACYTDPHADGCKGDSLDVALVRLAEPVTDVAPIPVIDRPLEYLWGAVSPFEGDSCTAVGFGAFLAGGKASAGVRRSAKSTIDDVGRAELVAVWGTGLATSGDSGGPLLCNGRVVGTVRGSSGPVPKASPYERTREGYVRTDVVRAWIAEAIARWG